nr:hypothetical protein [Tanacetum cinerariifolium]
MKVLFKSLFERALRPASSVKGGPTCSVKEGAASSVNKGAASSVKEGAASSVDEDKLRVRLLKELRVRFGVDAAMDLKEKHKVFNAYGKELSAATQKLIVKDLLSRDITSGIRAIWRTLLKKISFQHTKLTLSISMDSLSPQVVSAVKLPILNPNEFDLLKMRIEQYFLMTDYSLWEVILNGDSPVPTRIVEGVLQPVAPTTAE